MLGGKWEEVKRGFSFTFHWPPSMEPSIGHQAWNIPLATKHGTFHWPLSLKHSIGHQAWNLPLATKLETFHWPSSMEHSIGHQVLDLPSLPCSFSLKDEFGSLGTLSFPRHNFQFNIEYLFSQAFWGGKEGLISIKRRRMESRMKIL